MLRGEAHTRPRPRELEPCHVMNGVFIVRLRKCVHSTTYISADIVRRVGYLREDYWIPTRG